jgi:hypothetical protein
MNPYILFWRNLMHYINKMYNYEHCQWYILGNKQVSWPYHANHSCHLNMVKHLTVEQETFINSFFWHDVYRSNSKCHLKRKENLSFWNSLLHKSLWLGRVKNLKVSCSQGKFVAINIIMSGSRKR